MSQSKPHWLFVGAGALLLALVGAAAALGGPQDAWLKTRSVWAGQLPPQIISLEADPKQPDGTFVLTIRNPAVEDVVVTGYQAEPLDRFADLTANATTDLNAVEGGAGEVPLVTAEESNPGLCKGPRDVRLPRPFVVEPKRAGALTIRPWIGGCPFAVRVTSNHGQSETADSVEGTLRGWRNGP
jgi:hypothetical protein